MATKRFKVRVFIKAESPRDPGREDHSLAFNLEASNADKARAIATARLEEQGKAVVSISHAPDNGLVATIGREPRVGPPTTLVANVARPRPSSKKTPTRKAGAR